MEFDQSSNKSPNLQFSSLPTELKLQICSYLSARDITRLRLTAQAFHSFVDTNSAHLSSQICAREIKRLREFISYYVTYDGDVSFLEAFSRWAQLRGWAGHLTNLGFTANQLSIQAFSKHWTPLKRYPDLSQRAHQVAYDIADTLWQVHNHFHWPGIYGLPEIANAEQFTRIMRVVTEDMGDFTDAECISMYEELRATPRGRLTGPRRGPCQIPTGTVTFKDEKYAPNMPLCTLVRICSPVSFSRWIPPKQAVEAFGVPRLPWTHQFTYVVESDWAHRHVSSIMHMLRQGQDVEPLMVAAGLEELRIN